MQRKLLTMIIFVASFTPAVAIYSRASPFTIDGSTVYVNAGFVGVRTSTPVTVLDVNGDAQFGSGANKSTFTAAGLLKLTSSGIQWADGSTSTTASTGGGAGTSAASTFTILSSETSANDALTEVTGASITLTCAGDVGVEVVFEGSEAHSGSGGGTLKWVLMDEAYISNLCLNASCSSTRPAPWSSSVSMGGLGRDPGASSTAVFPFTIITPPFPCSAGSHNFKVKFKRSGGGTSYIACAPSGGTFTSAPCVFIVRESRR